MADSQIEEIKNKLNVLDIVGSYVKLTKTGINYRGVCPFHSEKTPSFFVSPTRQMWHCFGCGKGFSMFDFVMAIEGVEFGDALRILANKAGVQLKRENPQLRTERERLYEICELACKFFEKQLEGLAGREVQDYLIGRGITKDSIKKWRIGYSPDNWNSLTDFLIGKGYKRDEIVKAGLAIKKENNNDSYDRFRGRIIFTVFDLNSRAVGFGGRVFSAKGGSVASGKQFDQNIAKYINTPQTLLYNKSATLYGLNNAKLSVRKQNNCVITEGYTDVIMCHQAGFENTIAASGTALTWQHLNILKRYSENLVLAFDMDIAGDSATKRGINLAEEQGFNIKVIESYEKNLDPADIVAKNPKLWEEALLKTKSIMDYYFDSAFSSFNKETPEGKKEIGRIILPAIKRLQNKIEQSHWIQKLSQMLGIKEEVVLEELAKISLQSNEIRGTTQNPPVGGTQNYAEKELESKERRKKLIEEKIVALILKNPDYIKLIEQDHYQLFSHEINGFLRKLREIINLPEDQLKKEEEKRDFKSIFESVVADDNEFKNFIAALALKGDVAYEEDGQEEVKLCLLQLKNIELKNKLNEISENIKKAESESKHQKVNDLVEEFNKLTKDL
ncbi:MAG: DNA primase [Patescibacteria group bacterium]